MEVAKNKKITRDLKEDPRGSGLQVLEEPEDEPDESAINKQIACQRYAYVNNICLFTCSLLIFLFYGD